MLIRELTTAQCQEVLERTTIGRLACARDDQPYIVPILFYFDREDRCLYSFSTIGQKIEWMRANPKVCIEVDEVSDPFHWTSIVVLGWYEELRDPQGQSEARRRAHELFQRHDEWWLPAAGRLTSGKEHGTPVVYRIRIDQMTGRHADRGLRTNE